MGWVCPMCSSNNDSKDRTCIVCGELAPESVLKFDIQSQMDSANS